MPLHNPKGSFERILLMGMSGVGKTKAWLSIAKKAQLTRSPAKFYALDTDMTVARMLEGEDFNSLENVEWRPTFDWDEYKSNLSEFQAKATKDDFLIVDMVGPSWEAAQEWYVQKVFGKDMDDFFMEQRTNMKKGNSLDGWKDWSVINKVYRGWMVDLIFRTRAHVICTTGVDQISAETDDKSTKVTFGPYGVKPRGQKTLSHNFHTILLIACNKPTVDHYITTVKDRERKVLTKEQFTDFCMQYMISVAGWKLA